MSDYIVHSGWWCDESQRHIGAKYNDSDNRIRTPKFFDVWYDCVTRFASPRRVFIADSASPLKPDLTGKSIEWVSLAQNFQHGMICVGKFGGWTRAFALGAMYAYLNDAEYSVFLEQDCLIVGDGIIERAIENMSRAEISYGGTSVVRIEQSFVIIKRDYILRFLNDFLGMKASDRDVFTEVKFQRIQKREYALSFAGLNNSRFIPLPFGFGRNRPIDFAERCFYAQQWSRAELEALNQRLNLPSLSSLLSV
ncbi:MAG: hypothetical protein IPG71_05910 [bacterium]|nr:hypothetical protein [bacterium]